MTDLISVPYVTNLIYWYFLLYCLGTKKQGDLIGYLLGTFTWLIFIR